MNMERRDFFSVTSQNAKKKEKKTNTTKAEYIWIKVVNTFLRIPNLAS